MRFYINYHGKEYLIIQITWYSWGKIMKVTIYDDNHNLRTIYHDDYDLEKHVYAKENATATNSDKERNKTI